MEHTNKGKLLGELETEIMEIIWLDKKPVSVKDVMVLLQKKRKIAYKIYKQALRNCEIVRAEGCENCLENGNIFNKLNQN